MADLNPDFLDNSGGGTAFSPASSDLTLFPAFLTNVGVSFVPTIIAILDPAFLTNVSTVYNASVRFTQLPDFLQNQSTLFFPRIISAPIVVEPDFLINTSVAFDLSPDLEIAVPFLKNGSVTFDVNPVYNRTFLIPFLSSTSKLSKPIIKEQPIPRVPIEPDEIIRSDAALPASEQNTTGTGRIFKDIGMMFRPHPLTGDLTRVFDYDAINQSVRMIVMASVYERPYSSQEIAGNIRSKLFELGGPITVGEIREDLSLAIIRNEPRVIVEEINIVERPSDNAVELSIKYKVKTFKTSETLKLILERA